MAVIKHMINWSWFVYILRTTHIT